MIVETSDLPLTIRVRLKNGEAADLDHFIDCLHTHLPELAGLRRLGKLTYTPTSRNPLQSNYEVTFVGVQPSYSNEERQSAYIAAAADYLRHAPRPGYEIEDQLLHALDGRTPRPNTQTAETDRDGSLVPHLLILGRILSGEASPEEQQWLDQQFSAYPSIAQELQRLLEQTVTITACLKPDHDWQPARTALGFLRVCNQVEYDDVLRSTE